MEWREELPRPNWDLVERHLETIRPEDEKIAAWNDAVTQWLDQLCDTCPDYAWVESKFFYVFGPREGSVVRSASRQAESYYHDIYMTMPHFAELQSPGKLAVLIWGNDDDYYRYVSDFYGEGTFGMSGGMYLSAGYPHIAVHTFVGHSLGPTLAHELTHAVLGGHKLPLWIEEGLAQMFEVSIGGGYGLLLDPKQAKKHRRYWRMRGLGTFWFGEGFSAAGGVQSLCYQLAVVMLHLLVSEHQPRWFGFVRGRQERFVEFLRHAQVEDAGQASAEEHLGFGLEELAARFLGPGDWRPVTGGWSPDRPVRSS
ncbi:MAG: hypothetical protein C0483_11505 [Pirellula sp.]|nr:hypothetical protein [Pirellula sp.]